MNNSANIYILTNIEIYTCILYAFSASLISQIVAVFTIISTLLLCLLLLLAKFQRLMLQQQAAYYCGNWWWWRWTLIAAVAVVVVVVLRHKIFGELSTATRPTHVQTNKLMALYTKFYMHKYIHIYSIYIYPSKLYICRGVRYMHACALF